MSGSSRGRRWCVAVAMAASALASAPAQADDTRDVLLVGNNWDGTADVLDVPSYERIRRINIVPDLEARQMENLMPTRAPSAIFVREMVGEGHDQMVDDLYASKDGRTLYVSRPSFDDVVAIDLANGNIVWRTVLTGVRADHMAISPDRTRLAVSTASAAGPNAVDVLDTGTGSIVGTFPSGDTPHENNYSRDGSLIYHASIGRIYTPFDDPSMDATKGDRVFEIVDAHSLQVLKKWNMGAKLAEAGYPNMSSAVRPMALSPDEKWLYFQVSFFHGFVEFDLEHERVTRLARLPLSDATPERREDYILDSAHHGIAMNGAGTKLCVAGTSSNYAAIVHRDDFSYRVHPLGARTYWATTSADGHRCYVSVAGDDTMSILSYDTEQEVARVPVGDHPQRARIAKVSTAIFGAPAPASRARPRSVSLRVTRRGPSRFGLSGRLGLPPGIDSSEACTGIVRLDLRRSNAVVARAPAKLRRTRTGCAYARTLRVEQARGRLVANARFTGNDALLPRRARPRVMRLSARSG
jgi:DNA-binding beta-propeller fold protein YncE